MLQLRTATNDPVHLLIQYRQASTTQSYNFKYLNINYDKYSNGFWLKANSNNHTSYIINDKIIVSLSRDPRHTSSRKVVLFPQQSGGIWARDY